MNAIIVLLELEPSTEVIDSREVDIGARARWVHAAEAAPDAPDRPLTRTVCGADATEMEVEPYRPSAPGEPWFPPEHRSRRCPECDAALRGV
ncbi:hypothetical protein ABIA33_001558 [Streptacidiphilus sp. MAP12-16]|uniref:hypothetical protein n=1 Tax=Streptacidiphilus sp. MAP12-16 TaxID=3156300 RepID=UPI0035163C84